MAVASGRVRSEVEILARTRVAIASLVIYLLTMAFLALGDRVYAGTPHLFYSRLAAIPFFALLVIRWLRLVRVRPPEPLCEARRLIALNRPRAARDRLVQLQQRGLSRRETTRVDRARRLLQDGLAVPVADELVLEVGRCSLVLGELERAVNELRDARKRLPARADVAIELAEALHRSGETEEATDVLRAATPYIDAVDMQTLSDQPALMRLLTEIEIPRRSVFQRRIIAERSILGLLIAAAVAHGAHLYLGLF